MEEVFLNDITIFMEEIFINYNNFIYLWKKYF